MGRTSPFLFDTVMRDFDIYTVTFGDNERFYLRGQLTLFRNSFVTNNLWRRCRPLSNMSTRILNYQTHPSKRKSGRLNGWSFQSAEGCISKAAYKTKGIRVISPTVLASDAFHADFKERESLILGSTAMRCYREPLPQGDGAAGLTDTLVQATVSTDWYGLFYRFICFPLVFVG
jgi:hypothetical protein